MKQEYTAIIGRNFREMSSSPKVLLRDVHTMNGELFREHCWVKLSSKVRAVIPRGNTSIKIKFTGTLKPYIDYTTQEKKVTLTKLINITVL